MRLNKNYPDIVVLKLLAGLFLVSIIACKPLPKKRLNQFENKLSYTIENDTLKVSAINPIRCRLRVRASSENEEIQALLAKDFPLVLLPMSDSIYRYPTSVKKEDVKIRLSVTMGDLNETINPQKISLPFLEGGKSYIIQGYKGKYSHNSDYSRYAIDFQLKIGDTICAVEDAWVVGVIEDYKYGGKNRKWRDYANFITLYHPASKIFTQYVHLDHKGSLVSVGDKVKQGDPIALAGMTGFTDREHLHFNVLKASEKGMSSIEIAFQEGYLGKELKRGMWVKKPKRK